MDPQASQCGIYGRQNGTGTDILPNISAFPSQSSFYRCSILIYFSSYGWTVNPFHAAAPQRRGLPCHKRIKKQLWAQRRKFTHQTVTDGIKHNVLNIATVAPSYGVKYRVFCITSSMISCSNVHEQTESFSSVQSVCPSWSYRLNIIDFSSNCCLLREWNLVLQPTSKYCSVWEVYSAVHIGTYQGERRKLRHEELRTFPPLISNQSTRYSIRWCAGCLGV